MKAAPGTGTVEQRTNADGTVSYRARVTMADGRRKSGPWGPDPDEARRWSMDLREGLLDGTLRPRRGVTLAEWWDEWVDDLERLRKPRASHYRRNKRQHVERYPIARMPLADIDRAAVRDFVRAIQRAKVADGARTIATNTAKSVVSSMSACLTAAVEEGKLRANPMRDLKIDWPDEDEDEGELVYLEREQLDALASSPDVAEPDRLVVLFYAFTGLRAGEGVFMPLADLERAVETGEMFVRFGSKGRKPKGGKTRTVPLLPMAREVAERWLAALPSWCPSNQNALAFPRKGGGWRASNRVLNTASGASRWEAIQRSVGIEEPIVWHGLRHTFGAALASGWWGRTWALHEIRDVLGHSSVTTTERFYGHLTPHALREAAAATNAVPRGTMGPVSGQNPWLKTTSSPCRDGVVIPGGCVDFEALGTTAGLREAADALVASRVPSPAESAAIARAALALDPVSRAAQAVLDASPAHRFGRLLDLLELLPVATAARRGSGS